jgi:hypothetical protein
MTNLPLIPTISTVEEYRSHLTGLRAAMAKWHFMTKVTSPIALSAEDPASKDRELDEAISVLHKETIGSGFK